MSTKLVVATFDDEKAAREAFKSIKKARRHKEVDFEDAAVVSRDEKNRLHIKETGDIHPGEGAAVAGVLGAALGLLAGPAGVVIGGTMGAMIGAVASSADTGISDYRLGEIGDRLSQGTSAVVAVVDDMGVETISILLTDQGADIFIQDIDPDIAALMEAGDQD